MGEHADMILNGLVDQYTGEVIDGHAPGYPRSKRRVKRTYKKGDFKCEKCGRHYKTMTSLEQHVQDMHTPEGQARRRKQKHGY